MLARFALAVERFARAGTLVPAIAKQLNCSEEEVLAALRMLMVPIPHERDPRRIAQSEVDRAALMEKVPKKWQERYDKNKR